MSSAWIPSLDIFKLLVKLDVNGPQTPQRFPHQSLCCLWRKYFNSCGWIETDVSPQKNKIKKAKRTNPKMLGCLEACTVCSHDSTTNRIHDSLPHLKETKLSLKKQKQIVEPLSTFLMRWWLLKVSAIVRLCNCTKNASDWHNWVFICSDSLLL